jgi:hypothetical protein
MVTTPSRTRRRHHPRGGRKPRILFAFLRRVMTALINQTRTSGWKTRGRIPNVERCNFAEREKRTVNRKKNANREGILGPVAIWTRLERRFLEGGSSTRKRAST